MRFLKLPATLRWGLVNCLLIWIMMTVYRLILTSLLTGGVLSNFDIILKGMLVDFGAVSIPGLLFILFSFIPALHPYKTKRGMYFGLVFFSFFGFLYAIVYGLDLVFIKILASRISGDTLVSLKEDPLLAKAFRKNIPYLALTTGVTLLVWVWWLLLEWLYRTLGTIARAEEKVVRLFWQSLSMLVFISAFVKFGEFTGLLPDEYILTDENLKEAITANPVLTLLFK